MTWKEFKDQVEEKGVQDEMEISFIDYNGYEKRLLIEIIEVLDKDMIMR